MQSPFAIASRIVASRAAAVITRHYALPVPWASPAAPAAADRMYLVAIAWMYVVLMMAVVEATAPNGSVLGAVVTFLFYGVLPLSIVMYLLGTPMRRRALQQAEARADANAAAAAPAPAAAGSPGPADARGHAPGGAPGAVAAERKEA